MLVKVVKKVRGLPIAIPAHRHLILVLATYCTRPDGTGVYPSVPTLADDAGVSERTVQRHLDGLEEAGWIRPGDQTLADHLGAHAPSVWDLALSAAQAERWAPERSHARDDVRRAGRRGGKASAALRYGTQLDLLAGDSGGDMRGDSGGATGVTQIGTKELPNEVTTGLRPVPRQGRGEGNGGTMPAPGFEPEETPDPERRPGVEGINSEFYFRLKQADVHRQHDGGRFKGALRQRIKATGVDPETVLQMVEIYFDDTRNLANLDRRRYAYAQFLQLWADLHERVSASTKTHAPATQAHVEDFLGHLDRRF